jgi:hypothetical protein
VEGLVLLPNDLFPSNYLRGRLTAWESLLGAKDFWLLLRIDEHQAMVDLYKEQLRNPELDRDKRDAAKEFLKEHEKAVADTKAEQKILLRGTPQQKRDLVKKNVEAWIRNLRSRAADFRRYAAEEHKLAGEATTKQDIDRHEGNEQADNHEANDLEKMAGELSSDLAEAKL